MRWAQQGAQAASGGRNDEPIGPLGETITVLGNCAKLEDHTRVQRYYDMEVIDRGAAFVDISNTSGDPLRVGEETLMVNSSIMSTSYKPIQAGWLVDLELPLKRRA